MSDEEAYKVYYHPSILDNISKKNVGQLLGLLDDIGANEPIKSIVKNYFWKNIDDIKVNLENRRY